MFHMVGFRYLLHVAYDVEYYAQLVHQSFLLKMILPVRFIM